MDDQHVAKGFVVAAAIDDDATQDVGHRVDRRRHQRKGGRIDHDHRWRDDARLRQHRTHHAVANLGHGESDIDHRVPPRPTVAHADARAGHHRLLDDVLHTAVAEQMEARVQAQLAFVPGGQVISELALDPGFDRGRAAPGRIPPAVAHLAHLRRQHAHVFDQQRRVLHREWRRLVAEGRWIEDLGRGLATQVDDVVVAAAAHGDFHVGRRAQHIDLVLAAAAIDLQAFNEREINDAPRA